MSDLEVRDNQVQGTSRILLEPHIREIVDQIQERTQVKSPSQAIALMVSRYAKHLLETWELTPNHHEGGARNAASLKRIDALEGNLSASHIRQLRETAGDDLSTYQLLLEEACAALEVLKQKHQRSGYMHPTEGWVSSGWPH